MHCPCGARPESLATHHHVIGCPVEKLKIVLDHLRQERADAVKVMKCGHTLANLRDQQPPLVIHVGSESVTVEGCAACEALTAARVVEREQCAKRIMRLRKYPHHTWNPSGNHPTGGQQLVGLDDVLSSIRGTK